MLFYGMPYNHRRPMSDIVNTIMTKIKESESIFH